MKVPTYLLLLLLVAKCRSVYFFVWKKGITKAGTSADVLSSDRYRLGDYPNIHNTKDVIKIWQSRPPVLREAVAPYLWYPVTGAAIERSFGLVDVKNRQSMGKDLREACVTMFCNGDVD